ncbi:hypothetical protein ACFXDI_43920 [Streptomyces mirabilis]|uniref:hypothetical protein n=1 Tax=Streptomyces mirabilis TaxID=68239 RepID=UPI00367E2E37
MEARLLDAAMQAQTSGRSGRARAAHWALHPVPLAAPRGLSPTVRLTALALAAHTAHSSTGSAELALLVRLCGQSPQQLEDLLDQLVRSRLLASWQHVGEHDEISWRRCQLVRGGGAEGVVGPAGGLPVRLPRAGRQCR